MKKISIFLIGVHRFYYIALGAIIAVFVFNQVHNVPRMLPSIDVNPLVLVFLVASFILFRVIAFTEFYTNEEREATELSGEINCFQGSVQWDKYFPVKICTRLPLRKRFFGYIYALLRPVDFILQAYFCVMIVCLFIK